MAIVRFGLLFCAALLQAALITPLPSTLPYDKQKALLGQKLFHDPLLSRDATISCASCHALDRGGVDGLSSSVGIKGRRGDMNAPTVLNAVFHFRQFWDGRAATLVEQAGGPIANPVEMDFSLPEAVQRLKRSGDYPRLFGRIYPEGITPRTITDAIAEYEKTLITPDAPFDRYLKGDRNALTKNELAGYRLFERKGCISCHNGIAVGGNMYQKFGVMKSLPDQPLHWGRYKQTKQARDKFFFKVPSLRNIALTAPYLHDGSAATLEEAISRMGEYQLGIPLSKQEISHLSAFLKTLTGKKPQQP